MTNGLLAVELMTGRMQVGNNDFQQSCAATIPLASDTDDANAPTYATFGTLMNANYLLAGTVSTNPLLFILGTWLVLAWRVAGYYGGDRYLLPLLGTPWTGRLTAQPKPEVTPTPPPVPVMS